MPSQSVSCWRMLPALLSLLGLLGSGCGGNDEKQGSPTCAALIAKAQECGILSAGRVQCDFAGHEFNNCQLACVRDASCDQAEISFCDHGDNAIDDCVDVCIPDFECADGSGSGPAFTKCNGWEDCDDGSDELGCPAGISFECADGQKVGKSARCNGWDECSDGSDELGCPAGTSFECTDGETIPQSHRCNGWDECPDGSDELDCPTAGWFHCTSGDYVPPNLVCDLWSDCEDGSDEEQGCAEPSDTCSDFLL